MALTAILMLLKQRSKYFRSVGNSVCLGVLSNLFTILLNRSIFSMKCVSPEKKTFKKEV